VDLTGCAIHLFAFRQMRVSSLVSK
jgi:hypothetical protein